MQLPRDLSEPSKVTPEVVGFTYREDTVLMGGFRGRWGGFCFIINRSGFDVVHFSFEERKKAEDPQSNEIKVQ